MSRIIRVVFVVMLLAGLALPLATIHAQGSTNTRVFTEEGINDSFRVTNPRRATVTDVSVDLQPGQVTITSTHTTRNTSAEVVSVWTPTISNGRVTWWASSISADGIPASQEIVDQVNASIASSWRSFWRSQNPGRVESVVITEDDITYTLTPR